MSVTTLIGRRALLGGASFLTLLAAAPALAQQATPGSPQCPRSGTVVTCTGSIPNGFNSFQDNTMRELNFRNLTGPITPAAGAPVIDIRARNDLRLDMDSSVVINATNPRSAIDFDRAAIFIDTLELRSFNITSAATVNLTVDQSVSAVANAWLVKSARNVDFFNSGAITVNRTSGSGSTSAISIGALERVNIQNSGAISINGTGGRAIVATGRDITVTNSGAITHSSIDRELRPFQLQATGTLNAPGRIALNNSGTIVSSATLSSGGNDLTLNGPGTISFVNTGNVTLPPGELFPNQIGVVALSNEPTANLSITVENDGAFTGSGIRAVAGSPSSGFNDDTTLPNVVTIGLTNRGALSNALFSAYATGRTVQTTFANSGSGTGILSATADAIRTGSAILNFTNSGNLSIPAGGRQTLITGTSSHAMELVNSGTLSAPNAIRILGMQITQGVHQSAIGAAVNSYDYIFDAQVNVTNRGAMSLSATEAARGIFIPEAYSDFTLINTAPIAVSSSDTSNFGATGIAMIANGDMRLINSGAITANGSGASAAGILFSELSFGDRILASSIGSRLRGYDRAADLASGVTIETSADITANGAGGYALFGFLGVIDDITDRRFAGGIIDASPGNSTPGDRMTISNDRASAVINVGSGATLTGGTDTGSAIGVQGAGTVTLTNAGSIVGRGNAGTGAIVLGDLVATTGFGGGVPPRDAGLRLNLVDAVNAGTIRSDTGHGIWVQNGSISNLVNRGLILGGQASLRASGTGTIDNQTGGILEGAIRLEGAGSRVTNAGIVRMTGASFAASTINGDYVQTAGGTLALRHGAGGGDTMNLTGNFVLAGNLNLALGAPTANPLISVGGNLTIDGLLTVSDAGGFGNGIYRLFNYGGALTDNGLDLGALPNGARGSIQTAIAGQVNLLVAGGRIQFWDGSQTVGNNQIDGGSGTWNNATTNWTSVNGQVNEAWVSEFAVFQGTPGTVTIDAGGVSSSGLQFAVGGYTITGGALTLTAPATLRVGDGSAAGAGYTATIASVLAGTAGINKTDLGTLVLSSANTYSGGSRVSGGVLQVGADNNLGAVAGGVILDGGTLRFGGALISARTFTVGADGGTLDTQTNATLSGAIGGPGAFTKVGVGTLTLSGNSSAYAGQTNVNGGILNLTGNLGGTLTIAFGATLTGTGTTGNLTIGGTVAPGASPGTLNVNGNLTFQAGSTYAAELLAAGGTDLINVTGTATLQGGAVRVTALDPETSYVDGRRYTILTAGGGRTGTFAGLTESSAFLDFVLSYDANNAFLTVDVIRMFPDVALTFNQRQASTALMGLGQTAGSDSLAVYNAILLLEADAARAVFDLSSGEIYPVLLASGQRQGAARARRLLARANEGLGEGWGLWGGVSGEDGRTDADDNGAHYTHDEFGGELGVDYRGPGNRWAIGFGAGYADNDVTLADRASRAEGNGWHVGGYARYGTGGEGFTIAASAVHSSSDADVAREIAFGTLGRTARSNVDIDTNAVAGELRYGLGLGGGWSLGPSARIVHASSGYDGFIEAGADSLNLSGGDERDSITRYGGGVFARWDGADGAIDASVFYLRGGPSPTEMGLVITGAPGTAYRVRSAEGDGEAVAFSLGGRFVLGNGWSLAAGLEGAFGADERHLTGSATLGWQF